MFDQIKNRLLRINRAFGVEILLLPSDELIARVVILKLERSKVVKEKESQPFQSLEELQKLIPPGSPVAVTINGKGVLHKKIERDAWSENILERILPNANPADFYLDKFECETFYSIHVVRKAVYDSILDHLVRSKFRILSVSLGIPTIRYSIPYMNGIGPNEGIKANHHIIYVDHEKKIIDVQIISDDPGQTSASVEYNIGDQYVFAKNLLAFSSAMGLLAGAAFDDTDVVNATLAAEKREYRYFKYFKAASWSLLCVVFSLLLANFLVYMHYSRSNLEHVSSLLSTQEERQKTEKLEAEILAKEGFLNKYGWDRPARISFYADRIAALVPDDALLTDLKINPIVTSVLGGDGLPKFQQDTIQVSGSCEDPAELNRFANNLRNVVDFKEINIKSYLYKKEIQTGLFSMEIITL